MVSKCTSQIFTLIPSSSFLTLGMRHPRQALAITQTNLFSRQTQTVQDVAERLAMRTFATQNYEHINNNLSSTHFCFMY